MAERDPVDSPATLVFDVNETLSDLAGLRRHFAAAGLDPELVPTWFAGVLRDGFALSIAGAVTPFADVARAALRTLPPAPSEEAVEAVLASFLALDTHPDVVPGIGRLSQTGHRLVTLSNGAAAVAEALLDGAGVRGAFDLVLSVEDAGAWKPDPRAYAYAARRCGLEPGDLMLVAVHPWDIDGAARAGLRTAWLNRDGRRYPDVFAEPEVVATGVADLAERFG